MKKILSILMPVHNGEAHIKEAIESVIKYKTDNIEFIILDGESKDNTLNIVKLYEKYIDKIVSEKDNNVHEAINKGIKMAKGEWIFILASDDYLIYDPIDILKKYSCIGTDVISGNVIVKHGENKYEFCDSLEDLSKLDYFTSIRHPASFFKRKTYDEIGLYSEIYKTASDRDIFIRLRNHGYHFKFIKQYIVLFRAGGISNRNIIRGPFKEDLEISICYGVSKIKAYLFYYNRCFRLLGGKLLRKLKLKEEKQYLSWNEVSEILVNQELQL